MMLPSVNPLPCLKSFKLSSLRLNARVAEPLHYKYPELLAECDAKIKFIVGSFHTSVSY